MASQSEDTAEFSVFGATGHSILNPGLLYQVTVSVLHRFYSSENTQSLHAHDINIRLQPHLLVRQERRRPANKSLHPCYPITLHRAKKKGGGGGGMKRLASMAAECVELVNLEMAAVQWRTVCRGSARRYWCQMLRREKNPAT